MLPFWGSLDLYIFFNLFRLPGPWNFRSAVFVYLRLLVRVTLLANCVALILLQQCTLVWPPGCTCMVVFTLVYNNMRPQVDIFLSSWFFLVLDSRVFVARAPVGALGTWVTRLATWHPWVTREHRVDRFDSLVIYLMIYGLKVAQLLFIFSIIVIYILSQCVHGNCFIEYIS